MDCSLRNVSVRLKEPKPLDVDMNVENLSSRMPYNSSIEDKNNGIGETHLSIECDEKLSMISDVSEEVRDKLHIGCTSASNTNTGLLNGCSKMLYEDVKGVDFTKNGLTKHHNLDLISTHLDCYNSEKLCAENVKMCTIEIPRTDKSNVEAELKFDDCKSECVAKSESNSVGETISNAINTNSSVSEIEHEVLNNTYEYPSSSLCIGSCIGGANRDMHITYLGYDSESQMPDIMRLIQKDLSEPYSIYTYRYFIHNWPKLCFLAQDAEKCVGAIVCKLDIHKKHSRRGYIAMLAVDEKYRKRKIGSNLVLKAIKAMVQDNADEVVLETEITNKPALRLYENLGFVRDKRLFRYYLNGVDALRLKLWLR